MSHKCDKIVLVVVIEDTQLDILTHSFFPPFTFSAIMLLKTKNEKFPKISYLLAFFEREVVAAFLLQIVSQPFCFLLSEAEQ